MRSIVTALWLSLVRMARRNHEVCMIGRLQGMLDRLQHALPDMEQLSPKDQEELAAHIESLLERFERRTRAQKTRRPPSSWRDLIGAWSDDNVDEMFAELDRIRHANPPSSPLELR